MASAPESLPYDVEQAEAHGIEVVGYHDLENRGALKLGLHVANDRWYLYAGGLWHPGVSILDVTDPTKPELVRWMDGPADSFAFQLQVADGKLIHGLERPFEGYGLDTAKAREGFDVYDLADPTDPKLRGSWSTGHKAGEPGYYGTHRNFYDGGRYVHASATAPGFQGYIYRIVDIEDPANPVEVGRWWLPEQWNGTGEFLPGEPWPWKFLHGPAWVEGDRAYCSWADGGMIILDISDLSTPTLVSQLNPGPAFGSGLGVHTVVPLPERKLAVVNSESIAEGGSKREPLNYAVIVDIADETKPRIISWLPVPEPPEGSPYASFHDKPGRFGPHNQHHSQHHPHLLDDPNKVYLAYFNAGLRIYDISNEYRPYETGYFISPDPTERLGPMPSELVTQCEEVLVDSRGYIYTTDKNWGVHVFREVGA